MNTTKTPATVASPVTSATPEGWRWVETDPDDGYFVGPEWEAVDNSGGTLPLSLNFDPKEGPAHITLGDASSPFDMSPELARTLAKQLLDSAARLEKDSPALLGEPENAQAPAAIHPSWCAIPDCEFYEGAWDHSGIITSGLIDSDGQPTEAGINMHNGVPLVALYGINEDFGRPASHVKAISEFLAKVAMDVEVSIVEMDGRVAATPANGEGITVSTLSNLANELGVSVTACMSAWEKIHGLEAMRTR